MKIARAILFFYFCLFLFPRFIEAKSLNKPVTLIVTGDVMLGRNVNAIMTKKNDFSLPYAKIKTILKKADITLINLESPLVVGCKPTPIGMTFCGDERSAPALSQAGIDIVSLANNHMLNYGKKGLNDTKIVLLNVNIASIGYGSPHIISKHGLKIAFLAYNDIGGGAPFINTADPSVITSDIESIKDLVDFIVVYFHFGEEYMVTPTKRQVAIARATVDAGAHLIVGSHPHWVQEVELYKGRYIVYSHGNFIFDQMWSKKTREGVIGKYIFTKNKRIKASFIPIIIDDYTTPRLANRLEKVSILNRMKLP